MTVLAQSTLRTADAIEDAADLLEDIKSLLVAGFKAAGLPLPKHIAGAIEATEYDPDDPHPAEEDDEDGEVTPPHA